LLTPETKVLDFGCGLGDFLAYIRKDSGCQIYGLDFDPRLVEHLREIEGMNLISGELGDAGYEDQYFDLVTMWGALEHSFDPIRELKEVARILKPNGMVVVTTPNGESAVERIFKQNWFFHNAPQHLYCFSRHTLEMIMDKAGLQMLSQVYYPVTPMQIVLSLVLWMTPSNDMVRRLSTKKGDMHLLKGFGLLLGVALELPLAAVLSLAKISSRLRVLARKIH
jgi:SAM-dependent methyltransferase